MAAISVLGADADVGFQRREQRRRDRTFRVVVLFTTLVFGAIAFITAGTPMVLALAILLITATVALSRPILGVHLLIFLTLLGDPATAPWWPFSKNLSSRESIMFVNDGLSVTPLELLLATLYLACLVPAIARRGWQFHGGALVRPMLLVSVFLFLGLVRGYSGGNLDIALFEFRPLLYLVAVYFLIVNLFTKRAYYHQAMWVAMVATAGQSLLSLNYYLGLSEVDREGLESLSEHSATVQMNALFVFGLALVAFNGSRLQRRLIGVLAIPVAYTFLLSQRRAAMVALFAGGVLLLVALFQRRRAVFWTIAPFVVGISVAFLGATWNAGGIIGLPASAVKSVFFPAELTAANVSSDQYRQVEAINIWFTIRSSPLFGLGFGQPFSVVAPMPNISFFVYWQYLPHNSVLWLWIKTGFLGFVTIMYTIGRAVFSGARSLRQVSTPHEVALVLVGVSYVVMFTIFAYVDIAFTARTAVFLALCMAICADFGQAEPTADPTGSPDSERLPVATSPR